MNDYCIFKIKLMGFQIDVLKMKVWFKVKSFMTQNLRKNMKSSLIVSFIAMNDNRKIAILKSCDYRNRDFSKCHNRPIPNKKVFY